MYNAVLIQVSVYVIYNATPTHTHTTQSVVKLLIYALCHELPCDASPPSSTPPANDGDGQRGAQKLEGKEKLLPPWAAPSGVAATTRFGALWFCHCGMGFRWFLCEAGAISPLDRTVQV